MIETQDEMNCIRIIEANKGQNFSGYDRGKLYSHTTRIPEQTALCLHY